MSGADHPAGLAERFDPLYGPPNSLQRTIFEALQTTETEFMDLYLREIHERLRDRSNAEVCQAYFEKHIRKPVVLHREPRGDVRMEALQPASAKSVPLKSMSNAELTKLGLPVQRKNRHGTK